MDYYQSVETLNGYVISQWSNDEIDVRNPEDDDEESKAATDTYAKKLGIVKFYEAQLVKSSELKKEGLDNDDIKLLENKGMTSKEYSKSLQENARKSMFKKLFNDEHSRNNIRIGSRSAFIFEIQKLLIEKGYEIPVDGVFKQQLMKHCAPLKKKTIFFQMEVWMHLL